MRRPWSRSAEDGDTVAVLLVEDDSPTWVDVIEVDVVQDELADEFLALLHELALEAIALRASAPGNPRTETERPVPPEAATDRSLPRRLWDGLVAAWRWWWAAAD